ncbi:uncharacterized protein [Scyliorhinus torazame]|uniref:uncharacterized protein n=1 Tax=Scyliorhinus torazame TaxID=75743 RepID=UPI003B5A6E46
MYQTPQEHTYREQMVTSQLYPNGSGIFYRVQDGSKPLPQRPRSPNRNKPQPHYARCIRSNTRFINEPFAYMETEPTMSKQFHWMKYESPFLTRHVPTYSLESTQRHDYQNLTPKLHVQTRHGCNPNKYPCSGIVPQVDPSELLSPPKDYREYISFIHQYDARKYPNEPIRGKITELRLTASGVEEATSWSLCVYTDKPTEWKDSSQRRRNIPTYWRVTFGGTVKRGKRKYGGKHLGLTQALLHEFATDAVFWNLLIKTRPGGSSQGLHQNSC